MRSALTILLTVFSFYIKAQVAIGTTGSRPHASAMLDVQSNNKGFLPPRMNYEAIQSISSPAAGLQVYDTTYNCLRYFDGIKWVRLVGEVKEPLAPQGEAVLYGEGAGAQVYAEDICSDSSGNTYVSGWFINTVKFGNITFTATPVNTGDAFLVKYDKNGKVIWAKQFGNAANEQFKNITYFNNSICVTGVFGGTTMSIGSTVLNNSGQGAILVAKFDTNGNPVWAQAMNGPGVNRVSGVTADASGNFYVSGMYNGASLNFAPGFTHTSAGAYDAFIVKYNNAGTVQWAKPIGGFNDEKLNDIICYNNTIAATGYFESSSIVLNSFTLTNSGVGGDMMVIKLDVNGQTQWAERYGVPSTYEIGKAMTVDETGALYIAGEYELGNTQISGSVLTNKGNADGMLVRITSAGAATAYPIQSTAKEYIMGIAYCNSFVYLCGYSTQPTDLTIVNKTYPIINRGNNEIFVAKIFAPIPTTYQFQWMQQQGGQGDDYVTAICSDPLQKNVYTVGHCDLAPAIFGSMMLYTLGYYLWRYTRED